MADEYLDLHNLEETEIPFTVARIIDELLQASPECQLPDDVPLVISLPDLGVELPALECDFNVDIPLVPLPYYCTPSVSGTVTFSGSGTTSVNTVEPVTIGLDPASECNFLLSGDVEICVPVYQATLVPLTTGCFGPASWAVVWGATCGVTINGGGVPSSGTISPAAPGTYNFVFTCCDGEGGLEAHNQTITVPEPSGGGIITGSSDEITVTYDGGGSEISIEAAADGCGYILTPSASVNIDCAMFQANFEDDSNGDGGTERKVFYNGTEVGAVVTALIGSFEDKEDCKQELTIDSLVQVNLTKGLVLSTDNSGLSLACSDGGAPDLDISYDESDGSLSLTGTLPMACFGCAVGNDGTYYQDIDVAALGVSSISFDNGCCTTGDAGWTECGNLLKVGPSGTQLISLSATGADPRVTITNGSQTVTIDTNDFDDTAATEVKLREIAFCVGGEYRYRLVLCSEEYSP